MNRNVTVSGLLVELYGKEGSYVEVEVVFVVYWANMVPLNE
jgi:hypothetical protein